jgi:hypothetical protein
MIQIRGQDVNTYRVKGPIRRTSRSISNVAKNRCVVGVSYSLGSDTLGHGCMSGLGAHLAGDEDPAMTKTICGSSFSFLLGCASSLGASHR